MTTRKKSAAARTLSLVQCNAPEPLRLTHTSPDEPGLQGLAEWAATQKKRAEAALLRLELDSLQPANDGDDR